MTGPEHYKEAERLVAVAEAQDWTTEVAPYRGPALAAAQVHATLALSAATYDAAVIGGQQANADTWQAVTA